MYSFEYHRPSSLADALARLAENEDAKPLSGGMTLLPTMKQRLASPSELIDLAKLPELSGIARDGQSLIIGAATRHYDVSRSADVADAIPALANLAGLIGDPHVRHRGTIGGSVANNDPNADYPAACLGLGATIITSRREIAADNFFGSLFETALEPSELVVRIAFPIPERAAYMKFRNPASGYAMVGVFVAKTDAGVRVAVTGAGAGVFRVAEMEQALSASFTPAAIADIAIDPEPLTNDLHGTPEYRAHLVGVMAKRAVEAASQKG